jgi:hypothetical protein
MIKTKNFAVEARPRSKFHSTKDKEGKSASGQRRSQLDLPGSFFRFSIGIVRVQAQTLQKNVPSNPFSRVIF